MTLKGFFRALGCLVVPAVILWVPPAHASGAGPNGINIGMDFNWNSGPGGYTASFIAAVTGSGATLNNCAASPITAASTSCDFVFTYSVNNVAQTGVAPGGVYEHYPNYPSQPAFCDTNPSNSAPLTLFNCFNNDSFGQVFMASTTGTLSAFAFRLTCLNPAGTTLTGLIAAIYETNPGSTSIPALPLAQAPVDLSACPTLTSWANHQFTAGDFASIPINFSNVTLTAGHFYAVYFGGLTPGSQLPGTASHFSLSAPANVTSGTAFNLTVTALDPSNNVVTAYAGTVHFTSSDGSAILPANATLINGTGTFTVTLGTSGTQTITASDTANTSITGASQTAVAAAVSVPALSEWGLLLLGILLAAVAAREFRFA